MIHQCSGHSPIINRPVCFFAVLCGLAVSFNAGCDALACDPLQSHAANAGRSQLTMAGAPNLIKVPRLRQATDYTCGVCALQAVLSYYGEDVREDQLAKILKANSREGTRYKQIEQYCRKNGYNVEIKKEAEITDLETFLKMGRPVICLIQAWADSKPGRKGAKFDYASDWKDGHYVVAVGFDKDNIFFMDPSTSGTYAYIKRPEFLERWHDTDGHEKLRHFAMAVSKDKPYDAQAITELK